MALSVSCVDALLADAAGRGAHAATKRLNSAGEGAREGGERGASAGDEV